MDRLHILDKKIQKLKEKQEQIQTRQALLFYKGLEKIFKDGFCPNLVLDILSQAQATASAIQQQEWKTRAASFRQFSSSNKDSNPKEFESTNHQSGREAIPNDAQT
jgi:glutaredoxin-related protein